MVKAKIVTPRGSGEFPLVRVRNPWGNDVEWNGAWSDGSPEWAYIPDEEKERLGLDFDDDGEFWMSHRDWQSYFNEFQTTNLTPDALGEDNPFDWKVATHTASWVPGVSAGGCRNHKDTFASNPQFLVRLTDPDEKDDENRCTMLVNLMQNDRAMRKEGREILSIGFFIYSLGQEETERCSEDFFRRNNRCGGTDYFSPSRYVLVLISPFVVNPPLYRC